MDLTFKCQTLLQVPRGGRLVLGRRKPIQSWDNVLISRNHVQLHLQDDGSTLGLSVTGRNPVVVERQLQAEGGDWDVIAMVDPGGSAQLPLSSISVNHATRFFVLGARDESAIGLQPAAAPADPPATTTDISRDQAPSDPPAKRQRLDPPHSTTSTAAAAAAAAQQTARVAAASPPAAAAAAAAAPKTATGINPGSVSSAGPSRAAAAVGAGEAAAGRRDQTAAAMQGGAATPSAPRSGSANAAVPYDIESPVQMLRVRGLSPRFNEGCLGVRLSRLVSGPLQLALVSNYMVDMGWLLSCCPDLARARQFFVVHGERAESEAEMRQQAAAAGAPHLQLHRPPLPIAYGTHHSKAFLLTYATGLRLIIHTANCVSPDCNDKSQGLWVQDFPRKVAAVDTAAAATHGSVGPVVSTFERDLTAYFRTLALPAAMAAAVFDAIAAHDFSCARGSLVASVPGWHRGAAAVQSYGHMRLRRLLEQVPLPAGFQGSGAPAPAAAATSTAASTLSEGLVIQCSSMGSFDQAWLVDELGASMAAYRRPDQQPQGASALASPPPRPSGPRGSGPLPLAVVWPTVEEVRNSIEGWSAGLSIPGPSRNVNKPFLGRYYARWGGEVVGRQRAMPHIKTYTRYRGGQLAWFLVTSHNLSKAAWGDLQKNGTQLMIRSYELGVLVTPALEAAYRASPQFGFCCLDSGSISDQRQHQSGPHGQPHQGAGDASTAPPSRMIFRALSGAVDDTQGERPGAQDELVCSIPVPYSLPPAPYRAGEDKAWAVDTPQAGRDALGLPWGAPFSHYGHTQQD